MSITKIFLTFSLVLFSNIVFAQENKLIEGTVLDSEGLAAIGATIVETGTSNGTATDIDGKFSLQVSAKAKSVTVSYIGYETQIIEIGNKKDFLIKLTIEPTLIDEVVVVGYGTMKKSDLTGSVSSIKGDNMPMNGSTTVAQMMKGQLSGVNFNQYSTQPGAKVEMTIRGAAAGASPLIVIDGFPVSGFNEPETGNNFLKGSKEDVLDNINPEDIADIQVLKDASATSIYGSRAAGGVILITTKKGSKDRLDVSLKSSISLQNIIHKPEIMNAREYMTEVNRSILENYVYDQGYYPWGKKELPDYNTLLAEFINAHPGEPYGGFRYDPNAISSFTGGTDWYDEVTRNGLIQRYDLSVKGGGQSSRYLFSLGYLDNDGVAKNNNYKRISGRMNLDQDFTKWLRGGINISYVMTNSNDVPLSGKGDAYDLFRAARTFDPTLPVYNSDGSFTTMDASAFSKNPVSILEVDLQSKKENLLSTAYLEADIVRGLKIKGTVGYNRKVSTANSYIPSTTFEGKTDQGIASKSMAEQTDFLANIIATYNHVFNEKHAFTAMAGWEYQQFNSEGFNAGNKTFPYDDVKWNNLAIGAYEKPTVGSYKNKDESASFISRINYSFDNRYLLTINYRVDGSSNFAPNKQWGHFGGGAVSWRISEEKFLKDKLNWLDNLKLRFSAGITGNAGSLTNTRTFYSTGNSYNYYFNNKPAIGIGLAAVGNPNLSWESQRDINIGLDFGLFNNRLNGTIDIYERTIFNRIGWMNLASCQEVNKMVYNTKRIDKTKGVDVSLQAHIISTKNFDWNSNFTLTYYQDMTTKRDPSEVLEINDMEKFKWNGVWRYVSNGIIRPGERPVGQPNAKAGAIKIMDINGYKRDENGNKVFDKNGKPMYLGRPDGIIDRADMVRIGYNTPLPIGWQNTFRYKDFDLSVYIYGKFNTYKNNDYKSAADPVSLLQGSNTSKYVIDRYSFDNLSSAVPSFLHSTGQYGFGDYNLEKSWFIRLDDVTLGYTIPKNVTKRIIQSVRFYAGIKNLFVITPYDGADPEYDVYYTYPDVRTFTFGVDVKF